MSLYTVLKFIHILSAITAVGFSASYVIWIMRALAEPDKLPYVLRGIRFLDSRFTNPAFLLLLITGISMALTIGYPLTTFWIAAAIILFVVVALLGIFLYAPTFRRMRLAAENAQTSPAVLQDLVRRSIVMNLLVGGNVLVILGLMVFKP